MARTMSSCPQATSALLQANAAAESSLLEHWHTLARASASRPLELAAVIYIAAVAFAELTSAGPLSFPVIAPGFALILLALWRPKTRNIYAAQDDGRPPETIAPAAVVVAPLSDRAIALSPEPDRTTAWIELMARVSHELRTPLNAVIGFSDVMDSELLGPVGHPRYREYARHIRDSGRELLKSAEDTLAVTALLANPASLDRTTATSFAALTAEAWEAVCTAAARRRIDLEVVAPDDLDLLGDRRPLRQILANLLTEAVDRAANGTIVTLRATCDGDLVQLEFVARGAQAGPRPAEASLAVCLARALLNLHGATLIELQDGPSAWRAVTVLGCAAQRDFFAEPFSGAYDPARAI